MCSSGRGSVGSLDILAIGNHKLSSSIIRFVSFRSVLVQNVNESLYKNE